MDRDETPAEKAKRLTDAAADDDRAAEERVDANPTYSEYLEFRASHRRQLARDEGADRAD